MCCVEICARVFKACVLSPVYVLSRARMRKIMVHMTMLTFVRHPRPYVVLPTSIPRCRRLHAKADRRRHRPTTARPRNHRVRDRRPPLVRRHVPLVCVCFSLPPYDAYCRAITDGDISIVVGGQMQIFFTEEKRNGQKDIYILRTCLLFLRVVIVFVFFSRRLAVC